MPADSQTRDAACPRGCVDTEGCGCEWNAPNEQPAARIPEEELARWERETGEHRDSYPLDRDEYWAEGQR